MLFYNNDYMCLYSLQRLQPCLKFLTISDKSVPCINDAEVCAACTDNLLKLSCYSPIWNTVIEVLNWLIHKMFSIIYQAIWSPIILSYKHHQVTSFARKVFIFPSTNNIYRNSCFTVSTSYPYRIYSFI